MPVAPEGLWPVLLREDGRVVVEGEGEMVLDQVLARDAEVKGIPDQGSSEVNK